jgi:hypothetical protein
MFHLRASLLDVSFARQFTRRFQIFMEVAAAHSSSFSDADAGLDADSAMRKVVGFFIVCWACALVCDWRVQVEQALASSVKEKK